MGAKPYLFNKFQESEICSLLEAGYTARELSKKFDCHFESIENVYKRKFKGPFPVVVIPKQTMCELWSKRGSENPFPAFREKTIKQGLNYSIALKIVSWVDEDGNFCLQNRHMESRGC